VPVARTCRRWRVCLTRSKNLFDIEAEVTLAGSIINRSHAPAAQDAFLVARMKAAGAVLLGSLNMDEYAYGFTTENSHFGATHNPHDLSRSRGWRRQAAVVQRWRPVRWG